MVGEPSGWKVSPAFVSYDYGVVLWVKVYGRRPLRAHEALYVLATS